MSEVASLELKVTSSGIQQASGDLATLAQRGAEAERATSGLRREAEQAEVRWRTQSAQLSLISDQLGGYSGKANKAAKETAGLKGQVHELLAEYLSFEAAKSVIEGIVEATVEYEDLRARISGVTGSVESAAEAFEALEEIADKTKFTDDQLANAFLKLANFGLEPSERALKSYGNIASAVGADLEQLTEVTVSASLGVYRGLKAFGVNAEAVGNQLKLTFRGTTTTIGNSAQEIQNYLVKLGETQFAGAAARSLDTLGGSLKLLKATYENTLRDIGQTSLGELIKDAVDTAKSALEGLKDTLSSEFGDELVAAVKGTFTEIAAVIDKAFALVTLDKERYQRAEQTRRAIQEEIQLARLIKENDRAWKEALKEAGLDGGEDRLKKYNQGGSNKRMGKPVKNDWEKEFRDEYYALVANLDSEETKIEESYERRSAVIQMYAEKGTHLYDLLNTANTIRYAKELEEIKEKQGKEIEDLRRALMTEEEQIQDSYNRRLQIIENSMENPEGKAKLVARLKEEMDLKLQTIQDTRQQEREALQADYLKEEQQIQAEGQRKLRQLIKDRQQRIITQQEYDELELKLQKNTNKKLADLNLSYVQQTTQNAELMFQGLSTAAKNWGGESSEVYKGLFEAQKSFAIASATVAMYTDIAKAWEAGPIAGIPLAVKAAADFTQILAMLSSTQYSGAYDTGGYIPSGKRGKVAEYGGEMFLQGPAIVTSRQETTKMLERSGDGGLDLQLVVAPDQRTAAQYMKSSEGRRVIAAVVRQEAPTIRTIAGGR